MTESFEQQVAGALATIPHTEDCLKTPVVFPTVRGPMPLYGGALEPCTCDREARLAQAVAAAIAAAANYYSDTPQHKQDRALRALRGERP